LFKTDNLDEIIDICNDNSDLLKLGWKPKFDLESGLGDMFANSKG